MDKKFNFEKALYCEWEGAEGRVEEPDKENGWFRSVVGVGFGVTIKVKS